MSNNLGGRRATDVQTQDILIRITRIEPGAMGALEGDYVDVEVTEGPRKHLSLQSDTGLARGIIVDILNELLDEGGQNLAIERLGRRIDQ